MLFVVTVYRDSVAESLESRIHNGLPYWMCLGPEGVALIVLSHAVAPALALAAISLFCCIEVSASVRFWGIVAMSGVSLAFSLTFPNLMPSLIIEMGAPVLARLRLRNARTVQALGEFSVVAASIRKCTFSAYRKHSLMYEVAVDQSRFGLEESEAEVVFVPTRRFGRRSDHSKPGWHQRSSVLLGSETALIGRFKGRTIVVGPI